MSSGEDHRSALRGNGLFAALLLAALVFWAIAAAFGLSLNNARPDQFGLEAAKAALTVGTGLFLGGVLKLALDRHADTRQRQEQASIRFDRLLSDMRDVHEQLETSRLLIAAHRSSKTYRDRMGGVISAHVLLSKLAHEPGMGVCTPTKRDAKALASMLGYLRALQSEYRGKYKSVSDRQRFDEEVTTQRFKADSASWITGPQGEPPEASREAWDLLNSAVEFPVLEDLCKRGAQYVDYFLDLFQGLVKRMLDERLDGLRLRPVGGDKDWPSAPQAGAQDRAGGGRGHRPLRQAGGR